MAKTVLVGGVSTSMLLIPTCFRLKIRISLGRRRSVSSFPQALWCSRELDLTRNALQKGDSDEERQLLAGMKEKLVMGRDR